MPPEQAVATWKEFGTGALFLLLYLTTLYHFIKALKENSDKQQVMVERVVKALESADQAIRADAAMKADVKAAIETQARQSSELLAFLEGREEGRLKRTGG